MVVDEDSGGQQQHARLGGGLQWGRTRVGGDRWRRQRSGDDGCSKDCGSGQQWQRQTMSAADDKSIQDWAADYNGEGQEQAARDGGDSRVAMMAAATEDGGGR